MTRIRFALQKTLAVALFFAFALSSYNAASVLAWVHEDGSHCPDCTSLVAAPPVVDECCPLQPEAIVHENDCRVCCEPVKTKRLQLSVFHWFNPTVVPQVPVVAAPVEYSAFLFPAEQASVRRIALRSPPQLRGPPQL